MRHQSIIFEPGTLVRLPARSDWGTGQVQSHANGKITVNFENAGKVTLIANQVELAIVHQ